MNENISDPRVRCISDIFHVGNSLIYGYLFTVFYIEVVVDKISKSKYFMYINRLIFFQNCKNIPFVFKSILLLLALQSFHRL